MARKDAVVAQLRDGVAQLLKARKVTVVGQKGVLSGARSVTLQDGTDYESTLGRIREIVRRHEPGVAVEVCVPAGEAENRDAERDAAASAARRRDVNGFTGIFGTL